MSMRQRRPCADWQAGSGSPACSAHRVQPEREAADRRPRIGVHGDARSPICWPINSAASQKSSDIRFSLCRLGVFRRGDWTTVKSSVTAPPAPTYKIVSMCACTCVRGATRIAVKTVALPCFNLE
jgi:hypothetical protein